MPTENQWVGEVNTYIVVYKQIRDVFNSNQKNKGL